MVVLTIDTVGDERFVRGLNRYVADMKDFREVFEDIVQDFWKVEKKNFDSGGTPKPFPKAQNAAYIKWKMRKVGHNKRMILFGRLRGSLTGENQKELQDTVKRIGRTSAEFGTRVPYADYHRRVRGAKIVQLTEEDKIRWGRMIQRWAFRKLQEDIGEPMAPSLRSARSV